MKKKIVYFLFLFIFLLFTDCDPVKRLEKKCNDGILNSFQGTSEEDIDCGGKCDPCHCSNGILDGDEIAIDCGGSCDDNIDGVACHCSNGVLDGDEITVDCGGSCDNIVEGLPCHCFDNELSGDEVSVDCGGSCPERGDNPCHCFDNELSGDEVDIDCGGSCARICDTTPPQTEPHSVVENKELLIRDLNVVNSDKTRNGGPFSIEFLLGNMAPPGRTAKDMMLSMLRSWETPQPVNTFVVLARPSMRSAVIDAWKERDGQSGVSDANWNMNFENAPFRLLAIVNRIDLMRGDPSTGQVESAGEGRFVFGVLNASGGTEEFTLIFEYELLAENEEDIFEWAEIWHNLGTFQDFDQNYIDALVDVTNRFAGRNIAPNKPNGNAINQIRSNEIALDLLSNDPSPIWEFREFNLDGGTGLFKEVTRKMTPDISLNNSAVLARFVNANEQKLLDKTISLEDFDNLFEGQPFNAGNAVTPFGFTWSANGVNTDALDFLSFVSCNGCHAGTTNTVFTHVKPRSVNNQAAISQFLEEDVQIRKSKLSELTSNDLALMIIDSSDVGVVSAPRPRIDFTTRANRVH